MERQPTLLTDQSVVAVAVGRAQALAAARAPTVADLLLGVAQEPDGAASQFLRAAERPLTALAGRSLPPRLAPLDLAVDWATRDRGPDPVWTIDLLAAVVEAGGRDLRELLATVGLDAAVVTPGEDLVRASARGGCRAPADRAVARETVGLQPPGAPSGPLGGAAGRAVARVRALAGGAVDLLLALADDPTIDAALPSPDDLAVACGRLRADADDPAWDAGLDVVVAAAVTWCAGRQVEPADLVAAAMVAGGDGPRRLLDAAGG